MEDRLIRMGSEEALREQLVHLMMIVVAAYQHTSPGTRQTVDEIEDRARDIVSRASLELVRSTVELSVQVMLGNPDATVTQLPKKEETR